MKAVQFDCDSFAKDCRATIDAGGWGYQESVWRRSGLSRTTLHRLLKGEYIRDIESVLSIAAVLDLRVQDYVKVYQPKKVTVRVW